MDLGSLGLCCWTSGEGEVAALFHLNKVFIQNSRWTASEVRKELFSHIHQWKGKVCLHWLHTWMALNVIPDSAGGIVRLIWSIQTSGLGNDYELRDGHKAAAVQLYFDSTPPSLDLTPFSLEWEKTWEPGSTKSFPFAEGLLLNREMKKAGRPYQVFWSLSSSVTT